MSLFDSLKVSVFSLGIVFFVLMGLSFIVKIQSLAIAKIESMQKAALIKKEARNLTTTVHQAEELSSGELVLIDVPEKTAAMIMAIVSDETNIPLSELCFKSIKALD